MKWFVKRFGCLTLLLAPLLAVLFLFIGAGSTSNSGSASTLDGVQYVDHWSNGDAYTHNILIHRYGITAEQLDGFLDSTGIAYDKTRINGKKLLEWSNKSGLDVRAIVAIAQMESSFGTAGVATKPGANMFGYGAFDSNPDNASNYNDETAVVALTRVSIINNRNETFKIQDEKAKKNANGTVNVARDGGVYFTDTSGSGKERAEVMEKLDKWIDEHGGTPEPPKTTGSRTGGGVTSGNIPAGYSLTKAIDSSSYITSSYPWGQCTWFVWNRGRELGITFDPYMGNCGDWKYKPGYQTTRTPTKHSAICFSPGEGGSHPYYGHIAFVEQVKPDGSILISESNAQGLGVISYRVFDAQIAKQFTYVIGK